MKREIVLVEPFDGISWGAPASACTRTGPKLGIARLGAHRSKKGCYGTEEPPRSPETPGALLFTQ
jgi:hypothetical protein